MPELTSSDAQQFQQFFEHFFEQSDQQRVAEKGELKLAVATPSSDEEVMMEKAMEEANMMLLQFQMPKEIRNLKLTDKDSVEKNVEPIIEAGAQQMLVEQSNVQQKDSFTESKPAVERTTETARTQVFEEALPLQETPNISLKVASTDMPKDESIDTLADLPEAPSKNAVEATDSFVSKELLSETLQPETSAKPNQELNVENTVSQLIDFRPDFTTVRKLDQVKMQDFENSEQVTQKLVPELPTSQPESSKEIISEEVEFLLPKYESKDLVQTEQVKQVKTADKLPEKNESIPFEFVKEQVANVPTEKKITISWQNSQQFVQEIHETLNLSIKEIKINEATKIQVNLTPETLGEMEIHLEWKDEQVVAKIFVQKDEVKDLLDQKVMSLLVGVQTDKLIQSIIIEEMPQPLMDFTGQAMDFGTSQHSAKESGTKQKIGLKEFEDGIEEFVEQSSNGLSLYI